MRVRVSSELKELKYIQKHRIRDQRAKSYLRRGDEDTSKET